MVHRNSKGNPLQLTKLFLILVVLVGSALVLHAQQKTGSLEGTVFDKSTKEPLDLVNVLIEGTTFGAATDSKGYYNIRGIRVGLYTVRFSIIGYKERRFSNVWIIQGRNVLNAALEETLLQTDEVVVTPKPERYDASGISARLGKDMVASAPGSAQDIFWVVQTLPGITSDGDNSKLYVRGGNPDENLVLFDGATIANPFHFDMMGGGFWSIFN